MITFSIFLFLQHKRKFTWIENYKYRNREPYGGRILHDLLDDKFDDNYETFRYLSPDHLENNPEEKAAYILIGKKAFFKPENMDALTEFVLQGNVAFISLREFPQVLLNRLAISYCNPEGKYDRSSLYYSKGILNFFSEELTTKEGYYFEYVFENKETEYRWEYFDARNCDKGYIPRGYITAPTDDEVGYYNFIEVEYGKGKFYLHTTPLAFSNLSLLDSAKLDYTEKTLSLVLEDIQTVYWDDYSKIEPVINKGPLQYILSQPGLRQAFYVILVGTIIYLLFASKRRQRVIPVINQNENMSVNFAQIVGKLYLKYENHYRIGKYKLEMWLAYLRRHYHIRTRMTDANFKEKLIKNSGIRPALAEEIIEIVQEMQETKTLAKRELKKLNSLIQNFYKESR